MLLARKGYRVLLVDRARFPSDLPMSTHIVWQPGVARLKLWGMFDNVARPVPRRSPPHTLRSALSLSMVGCRDRKV